VVKDFDLPPKLNRDPRPGRYVGSCGGRLLPRHAAAHSVQFETKILSGFHGTAYRLAYQERHFDSTLLDIENNGACNGQIRCSHS
jgi:hypothetical protein